MPLALDAPKPQPTYLIMPIYPMPAFTSQPFLAITSPGRTAVLPLRSVASYTHLPRCIPYELGVPCVSATPADNELLEGSGSFTFVSSLALSLCPDTCPAGERRAWAALPLEQSLW